MQLTGTDIAGVLLGAASIAFNLFQLYKERVIRSAFKQERQLQQSLLRAVADAMRGGAAQIADLERKGDSARAIRAAADALLKSQLVHIEQAIATPSSSIPHALSTTSHTLATGAPELFEGVDSLTCAMVDAVERTDRFIFVVGGRSRNDAYLAALSQRVKRGDVRYVRAS